MRTFAIIAMLLGCMSSPVAEAAQAQRVTILELKRNPNRYEQRVVRLRGQFDQCAGVTCNFCPEEMTTATADVDRCIPLGFVENLPLPAANKSLDNIPFARRLYRFSTVTLEATFTAVCFNDEHGKPIGDVLCTGWPSNLYKPQILEVHSRKSALNGLITSWGDIGPLAAATAEESDAMLKELETVLQGAPNLKVFSIQLDPIEVENKRRGDPFVIEGLGCVCMDGTCDDGKWPARAFYGMNSPANPFDCWFMQKLDTGWRVLPSLD